eukprot:Hpha_TRINITY_DN8847_c0_g2::TRINITY_DN8847_c0_g2_i1::g.141432::m.141432
MEDDAAAMELVRLWRTVRQQCPTTGDSGRAERLASIVSRDTGAPAHVVLGWLQLPAQFRPPPELMAAGGYSMGDIAASIRRRPGGQSPSQLPFEGGRVSPQTSFELTADPSFEPPVEESLGRDITVVKRAGRVGVMFIATSVTGVVAGGAAEAAGIHAGMTFIAVDGKRVSTQEEVTKAFAHAPAEFCVTVEAEEGTEDKRRHIAAAVQVLQGFAAQAVECGKTAMDQGLLLRSVVEDQEPSLFLGLPGLTLLDCALHSLNEPIESHYLRLKDGTKVAPETFSDDPGKLALHHALVEGRRLVQKGKLTEDERGRLRVAVLNAGGDDGSVGITRIASFFQSIATDLSRLPEFPKIFSGVMTRLLD